VDEFSGATSKGKETVTPTVARVTKVAWRFEGMADGRRGRGKRSWSIIFFTRIFRGRS